MTVPASRPTSPATAPISPSTEWMGGECAEMAGKTSLLIMVSRSGKCPRSATQVDRLTK